MTSPAADGAVPSDSAPNGAAARPVDSVTPVAAAAVEPGATVASDQVTVRRAPRIGRFVVLGAGVGAIVTFILTALFPVDKLVGFGALFGYFALYGIPIGAGVGALFAILFDVIATRRAKRLHAERIRVDAPDVQLEGELED